MRPRPSFKLSELRPAAIAAGVYGCLASLLLVYTWCRTKPEYHGFDWLPVCLIAYPGLYLNFFFAGSRSNPEAALTGIIGNTAGIFIVVLGRRWIVRLGQR